MGNAGRLTNRLPSALRGSSYAAQKSSTISNIGSAGGGLNEIEDEQAKQQVAREKFE